MRARENPFRTARLETLSFRRGQTSNDDLWQALLEQGLRGAIVGPHGSGKTTLLREVARRVEARGLRVAHRFLNEDSARPSATDLVRECRSLGPRDVLLFDGAGHLGRLTWRRVRRAAAGAGGIVVTAHAPGLLPTWVETSSDRALLGRLTRELIGERAVGMTPLLETLHARYDGNLHDVFLALYDLAAAGDDRLRHSTD